MLEAIYEPAAYFERARLVGRALNRPNHPEKFDLKEALYDFKFLMRLMWRMTITRPELRRPFWRTFTDVAWNNPAALEYVIIMITFYLHLGTFAAFVTNGLDHQIALEEENPPARSNPVLPGIRPPMAAASFG